MSSSADSDSLLFIDQAPNGWRQPLARVWEDSVANPNLCGQTGTGSQSTRQHFKKLGIAPRSVFSRPRTPNDTLRARIDVLSGTIKSQPVYPGCFAGVPTAVAYFTGIYALYNDLRPLTTLAMLTPNQVHTGQYAAILPARQARQAHALDHRRDAGHAPFTLEKLIAQPLPDVSQCPVYSWAGPNAVPQNARHPSRN